MRATLKVLLLGGGGLFFVVFPTAGRAAEVDSPARAARLFRLERMQAELKEKGHNFTVGYNPALQYPLDELCGLKEPSGWRERGPFRSLRVSADLPSDFDWREEGIVPPVRDQGNCGSCWAFGSVGPLEANIHWKGGPEVDLSEQWLVSCNTEGWGCDGGWWAHDYHVNPGAVLEADFPYVSGESGWEPPCGGPYNHPYGIDSWAYLAGEWSIPAVDQIKQAIYTYGPVSVAIVVNDFFHAYTGGIFDYDETGEVNHAVVLVGWNDDQGPGDGYWILRNSWSEDWGENGYMRIRYGTSRVGYSACYIVYSEMLPPEIEISPSSLAVDLPPGGEAVRQLTISNTGAGALNYTLNWSPLEERKASGKKDAFGYSWKDSNEPGGPEYSWREISSTGTNAELNDDEYLTVPLPFTFSFYGEEKNSISISDNGYLTFGETTQHYNWVNTPLPYSSLPNDLIAPFWDDLDPGIWGGGDIYYCSSSSPDCFIIEYKELLHYDDYFSDDPETFEVILYPDGKIVYQYQTVSNPQFDEDGCTVGIENAAGDIGLEVAYDDGGYPESGLAVEISRQKPWLYLSPRSGNISPGEVQEIEVAFDAAELAPGIYSGEIILTGNDPDEGELRITVTMNVGSTYLNVESGDYNGNGTDDIAIFRGAGGLWAVRGITRAYFGSAFDLPVPLDYNGDGTTEIGIYRGSSGLWAIRNITRIYFGSSADLPAPRDYDGDGRSDLGIFRPDAGLWAIRGRTRIYFGTSSDTPVTGDFNGDGTHDIGLFRGSKGMWALKDISRIYFGAEGDLVSVDDHDGDQASDIAIYRPSSGFWMIRGITRCYHGQPGDNPVLADYGGAGAAQIAIFRPGTGLWAVRGLSRLYYGGREDLPVTR